MIFDEETTLVKDINDAALNLYGYDREEFLQLIAADILADPSKVAQGEKEIIDGKTQNILLQYHKIRMGPYSLQRCLQGPSFFKTVG